MSDRIARNDARDASSHSCIARQKFQKEFAFLFFFN